MASIELTMDELKTLIAEIVDEKLEQQAHEPALSRVHRLPGRKRETRSLDELFAVLDRNMWTPPDSPSAAELVREDRESR